MFFSSFLDFTATFFLRLSTLNVPEPTILAENNRPNRLSWDVLGDTLSTEKEQVE